MFASRRIRTVLGIGAALAVVAAIGVGVASASSASGTNRYVSATSSTGDVTQTYTATGTITRKGTSTASFATSGTVSSVKVAVGDQVEAGQVLATLDARALKLAMLQAETTVAQAELNLYNAKHPSSSSSAKKSTSTSSTKKKATTTGLTTVTFNLTALNEAVSAVNLAVVTEAKSCDAIMAWVNEEVVGSASTTKTDTSSTGSPSASASATPSASASSEVSAAEASASPTATATATQYAATSDPTEDEIKACATARASLVAANTTLQTVMSAVNAAANPSDDNSSPSGGSGSGSGSSSSSTSVSASAVAAAKANLLQAEQKLASAKADLAEAELVAPISGTVGTVGLTQGESSSSGSVTIVGTGNAVATFALPLTTRQLVKVGTPVTVTPAGSSKTLTGKITWISALETSGTSGSTATYSTTVAVTDPDSLLYSGSKASVLIPVKSATSVVRVPASAVTPTGTGTATVQTLTSAAATSATTVTVQTGAVGGGWVQITSGLNAGQLVVLADSTEAIPTTTNNLRRSSSSTSSTRSSASATALPSTGTGASSQPSAAATK